MLGAAPQDAWLLGDSRYDREAAGEAGVYFVGYRIEGQARVESLPGLLALFDA